MTAILALSCRPMEDLDFSKGHGAPRPLAPVAPLYVPEVARAFFESAGREERIAAGTVLFAENEKASRLLLRRDKMYFLVEGEISLVTRGKQLGSPKAGDIFGEMAAISDSPRSASAIAKTDCRVIALDDKGFSAALEKQPEFALMMLGTMILRLRAVTGPLAGVPSGAVLRESRVFEKPLPARRSRAWADKPWCAMTETRSSWSPAR